MNDPRATIAGTFVPRWDHHVMDDAADSILAALSAAGLTVAPTSLIANARTVLAYAQTGVLPKSNVDPVDALAASFAQLDGDDPLEVFKGKP